MFQNNLSKIESCGEKKKVKPLLKYLSDRNAENRAAAAVALRNIKSEDVANALVSALSDSDTRVVVAAAESLGVIGHARASEHLRHLMENSPNEEIKAACKQALGSIPKSR